MTVQLKTLDLSRTYTNAEFEATPEFDGRNELLDGKIVEKPMPGEIHSWICRVIQGEIYRFDPKAKLGAMYAEATCAIKPGWEPVPDLAYVVASRRAGVHSEKSIKVIPDLVVEVHSPHDLDSQLEYNKALNKLQQYLAVGVKIVWAINPRKQIVEVYHTGQAVPLMLLDIADELDGEDVIPGFKLKVADLFD